MAKPIAFKRNEWTNLAIDIQKLERRAYDLGMFATARFLNKAQQESGWEMARVAEMLAKKRNDSKGGSE